MNQFSNTGQNILEKIIVFAGYEENMAWELRQCWHIYLNRIKNEIALVTRATQ